MATAVSSLDILYLAWNRIGFTRFSFEQLLANTDWDLVDRLVVWDDYSEDGTLDYLREAIEGCPVEHELRVGGYRSPVSIMNRYIDQYDADVFAKIDNDVVVPPGWLNDMVAVMDASPDLELLGMQAAFTQTRGPEPAPGGSGVHGWTPSGHIGGVGLMRRDAFTSRRPLIAGGRFGFTGWQEKYEPTLGWITPDLHVCCLDQIPFEPWRSLSLDYMSRGWQRAWQPYMPDSYYWHWWPPEAKERTA